MVIFYWYDASVFVAFSLMGTVDCILVLNPFTDKGIRALFLRTSGPFISSCHLSIKFNGFLDLETNGLVSLRYRIHGNGNFAEDPVPQRNKSVGFKIKETVELDAQMAR